MRLRTVLAFVACACMGGSAMLAAPGQTQQPGTMTQARVWVQNRGAGEALPVAVEAMNVQSPLRVRVVSGGMDPVIVQPLRDTWEYQTIPVTAGVDAADALRRPGAEGWETTGVVFQSAEQTQVLMKRRFPPRP
jgi:hypothetical protein